MKSIKSKLKKVVLSGGLILGIAMYVHSTQAASNNWTEPSSNPPSSNLKAPINTSVAWQEKEGGLAINTAGEKMTALLANGNVYVNGIGRFYSYGSESSGPYMEIGMVDSANYNTVNRTKGPWIYGFSDIPGVSSMNGSVGIRVGNQGADSALVVGRGNDQYADVRASTFISDNKFRIGTITNSSKYNQVDNTNGPWIYSFDVSPNAPSLAGSVGIRVDGTKSGSAALIVGKGKGQFADVWASAFRRGSDVRLKKDIKTVDNALNRLNNIRGVEYKLKDNNEASIGVIAQEIENDFPSLVSEGPNGYKTVNYDGFIGVLIEAVKDQQAEIKQLQQEVNELKNK